MAERLGTATSEFAKMDRCEGLAHRPRVLLGKMGLDGHDRGVKVIARALRDSGVHVIYSGLWQTPESLAVSARDEDVDVIAASMMSNSHLALGPKLVEELGRLGRGDIPVHMGGIIPQEDLPKLLAAGISRCFTTGTGLEDVVRAVTETVREHTPFIGGASSMDGAPRVGQLARNISLVHDGRPCCAEAGRKRPTRVIGVTGSPGAGKSTLVARLVGEYSRRAESDPSLGRCAVVAFDPKSPITGGALLGDRLRVDFNNLGERVFYRSLAIRGEDYAGLEPVIELIGGACEGAESYETVFVETVGAGQNETRIRDYVDETLVVLTPGMGDAVQMEKAGILEIADRFVCNKADHPGEHELVRDLRDIAGKRPIFETVATRGQGVPELLDALLG
ncbi:MAG: methylmalonyl-CoA mutase cobalamin-binding domain/chain [Phycisphaerales bacterium]|jgi:methylmalonyl-CoA mutase cobalamin-binding domain/chain